MSVSTTFTIFRKNLKNISYSDHNFKKIRISRIIIATWWGLGILLIGCQKDESTAWDEPFLYKSQQLQSEKELEEIYINEAKLDPPSALLVFLRELYANGLYPDTLWMDSLVQETDYDTFSAKQMIKFNLLRGMLCRSQSRPKQGYDLLDGIYPHRDSLHASDRLYLLNELVVLSDY